MVDPASLRRPGFGYCVSIVMIAVSTASTVSTFLIIVAAPPMPALVAPARVAVIRLRRSIVDRCRLHINRWLAVVNGCRLHVHRTRLNIHGLRLHVDGLRIHRIGIGRTETNARHADTY